MRATLTTAILFGALAGSAHAAIIDFTGGTVKRLDSSTETTNNSANWDNVDYYEQGGFRIDFLPDAGSAGFATHVGDYYGIGNDVIHTHWATGNFGGVNSVKITQIGGGTFDINFFTLTSNTDTGGGPASGNEQAWVRGSVGGVATGPDVLLPSQGWGLIDGFTVVFLPSYFDSVDTVEFFVTNKVDCFGMDNFYINEVPAPSAAALLGLAGVVAGRRRR